MRTSVCSYNLSCRSHLIGQCHIFFFFSFHGHRSLQTLFFSFLSCVSSSLSRFLAQHTHTHTHQEPKEGGCSLLLGRRLTLDSKRLRCKGMWS